jgi:formate dehydrogenase major subunit
VPGLGTSFGRGGATNPPTELRHSDCVFIMGSNMAECHPVAFRWVVEAKTRPQNPAVVIHADPRFTRTSALATIYAPLRAGSDIAFLGGVIRSVLERLDPIFDKPADSLTPRERFHRDYLVHYTNAATRVTDDYTDAEDGGGVFGGLNAQQRAYDLTKWRYDNGTVDGRLKPGRIRNDDRGGLPPSKKDDRNKPLAQIVKEEVPPPAKTDPALRDPKCVWQVLRRHYARYTPEMVEDVCGTPRETFHKVAEAVWENSGPDRTTAICYAVGWTQHTVGVQMIRAASVLQLLLGNIGRPGGGIVALRGHASIQGSTDIATLYDLHPGYLKTPNAKRDNQHLAEYVKDQVSASSYWAGFPSFIVSQMRSWFGDAGTKENGFGYDWLPQIVGDHSHQQLFVDMQNGLVKGFFAMGQNPAVGGQNASYQRQALAKLDWLVVRDLYETETATFWKDSPEVKDGRLKPEQIPTEVFFLPTAGVAEVDGSLTNTQRLMQFHEKAVDPPEDARSDAWFTVHLGLKLKELYKDSALPRDAGIKALVWDYIDPAENTEWRIKDEPSARLILKEINGYTWGPGGLKGGVPLTSFDKLKDDGSTACGAWIYSGIFAPTEAEPMGHNHAANRNGDDWVSLGWGFAWPANRRILYNRASADLQGRPWPKEMRLARESGRPGARGYVSWDPAAKKWAGVDVPDFPTTKPPDAKADPNGVGLQTQDGTSPFIMQADGKGWLYAPTGLKDGPLPTHYEPYESPVANAVYKQQSNPVAIVWNVPGNTYAPVGSPDYPHVCSTYRLTEHHLSGVMTRWLPWLAELMPELFCEISPELAAELGVGNTQFVRITSARGSVRAKALVTRRMRPLVVRGRTIHHVGLPWHWGYKGVSTGDVVNDLAALVGDPNVSIHEAKVFVCNIRRDGA